MEIQISYLIPIQRTGISFHHLEPPVAFSLAEWFGNKKQAHHTRPHIGKYLQCLPSALFLGVGKRAFCISLFANSTLCFISMLEVEVFSYYITSL